jgi:hypothetical protein
VTSFKILDRHDKQYRRTASFEERDATDGVGKGPVSKAQPGEAQPVAAEPTKVGENSPKLDDLTLHVLVCAEVCIEIASEANKVMAVNNFNPADFIFASCKLRNLRLAEGNH